MEEFLQRLKQRKLVQWALTYVAAAFALLQGLDIIAQQFGWPDGIRRGITIALAIGFFVTLVLAWYHGERGTQRASGTELLILALLLTIGGAVLWRVANTPHEALVTTAAPSVHPDHTHATTSAAVPASDKSIAVLPFTDLSPGHDQEYFSDGMAEEILNALAQVRDLKVAGRTSSFYYKGKNEDLRAIGKALGVANILEGSVRKQGDKVRITAQLIRSDDDFHLWSQAYDGDLSDVFQLQERIARAITDQLKAVLNDDQKTRLVPVATTSPEAYALYLRATAIFNRRDGVHIPDAIDELKEAIRLDPKYDRAHARLASLYAVANNYAVLDEAQSFAAGEHEAQVASELDPALAEPYAALGTIYEYRRQWIASMAASERAAELEPGDPIANFWFGLIQIDAGYRSKGIASIDRALSLDPLLPNALAWRAFWYLDAGDRESARRMAQRSVDEGLRFGDTILAMLAHAEGHDGDAIARLTRGPPGNFVALPDGTSAILAQGVYGGAAERAAAVALIDTYLASKPKTVSGAAPWSLLLLGEPARALALAADPQTSNDTLVLSWLWSSQGSVARKLPQFAEFARKNGLVEVWEKYGPPDSCHRKAAGDYVCE